MAKPKPALKNNVDINRLLINDEEYSILMQIHRDVSDIQGKKDKLSFSQILYNDNMRGISFSSDLKYPVLNGHLQYIDVGSHLLPFMYADSRTFLSLQIMKLTSSSKEGSAQDPELIFDHTFLLTKFNLISRTTEETEWNIEFISVNWFAYSNYINYSSNGEKTVTDICRDLMKQSGLNIKAVKQNRRKGSSNKLHYITPTNYNLKDNLDFLLKNAAGEEDGLFVITYNHMFDEYKIVSISQEFINLNLNPKANIKSVVKLNNILVLPSKNQIATGSQGRQSISDFKEINENGADFVTELTKRIELKEFNHLTRKWTSNDFSFKSIFNTLPKEQVSTFEKNINPPAPVLDPEVAHYTREIYPKNPFIYQESAINLFYYTNVIEFKCFGDISRQAGEFIYLTVPDSDTTHSRYVGFWYILRVKHEIDKKEYWTTVQACRVDRKIVPGEQIGHNDG